MLSSYLRMPRQRGLFPSGFRPNFCKRFSLPSHLILNVVTVMIQDNNESYEVRHNTVFFDHLLLNLGLRIHFCTLLFR
jgi:hypothetical protein